MATREHRPGCPRLQFWDAGVWDAPCTCFDHEQEEDYEDEEEE